METSLKVPIRFSTHGGRESKPESLAAVLR